MKKISMIIIMFLASLCFLDETMAYYNTSNSYINDFYTKKYNLNLLGNGGVFIDENIQVKNNEIVLPTPERYGYQFIGFNDKNNIQYSTIINNIDDVNNNELKANWNINTYSINYNLDGGQITTTTRFNYTVEDNFTLPIPVRDGYTFIGWTGGGINNPSTNVIISNSIGDRTYTANWSKNVYTVNYYVNGGLWTQRSVAYGDSIENLNPQSILDEYHTFKGWNNWINNMPASNVDLYAVIDEAYCRLTTGHGQLSNANALLKVFQNAGWTGRVEEHPNNPGNYLVVTDYTLTRAEADVQKDYIAKNTNYTNFNPPYLYWVGIDCTNGYNGSWSRSQGQSTFK